MAVVELARVTRRHARGHWFKSWRCQQWWDFCKYLLYLIHPVFSLRAVSLFLLVGKYVLFKLWHWGKPRLACRPISAGYAGIIYELLLAKSGLHVISSLCVADMDFIIHYLCVS